jgi:hypothetical protein
MKKLIWIFFALAAELALAAGRLSSVSVSENGTVMLTTGNPNEFKASWSGQAGQYKMIIELPGVTVDKTAKVVGDLAANRGIKNVRFSQFQTEPPVARVIIETPERLSYSWSTKPEGVELHFMLPSPVTTTAKAAPTTGFAVPSSVFSQNGAAEPSAPTGKKLVPPPASTVRQPGGTVAAAKEPKTEVKTSTATTPPSPATTAPVTVAAGKPLPVVSAPKGSTSVSTGIKGIVAKTADSAAKTGTVTTVPPSAGVTGKQTVTKDTEKSTSSVTGTVTAGPLPPPSAAPASGKQELTVKTPVSGPQKESAPTSAISIPQGKAGTTTTAKSIPSATTSPVSTGGGTGVVVKPASPVSGQAAQTDKSKTTTAVPTAIPSAPATATVKPGTAGTTTVPTAAGKPANSTPSPAGTTVTKPGVSGSAADTVSQEKFKEQLKKALGKLETPAQPTATKPAETGAKTAVPVGKPGQTSFQEQLKQALDPAKSLTDTGEVADVDDIDTDLPATDEEEEEPYDTTFAFPGGTFMQVSPSRKVIRYHSEGRRDPFSPLTGRDRYASGKKRRAVPAAEQLRLVGIMRSLAGNKALLEDGEGNGYILAPGDRVRNGYLVSVSESKVLFQVTEYGWTKTVAMELGTFE